MAEVSFINPLSEEGRGIIRGYGDLNQLFEEDDNLIDINDAFKLFSYSRFDADCYMKNLRDDSPDKEDAEEL